MFKYECKQNHNYYPLDYALKIDRLNEKIFETFWQKQLHNKLNISILIIVGGSYG